MNKPRILVVEDEALIAANIVHTLTSLGHTVHGPVATGEDAIRSVKTQKPDLVLMDIQLIGPMDGIEAAEKIRAIADIPVVYLTAHTDHLRLEQAQLTEPYGYIVKPAHGRELNATIEMALYKHALDRKLKESDERYRSLFDRSLDCVYLTDFTGNFIDANKAALTLLGYTRNEITSLNFASLLTTEQLSTAIKVNQEIIATGGQKKSSEYRVRCRDGTYVDVETTASLVYQQGKPYAVQGIARDITGRKRIEKTLKESETKYRMLVETLNEGIWVIDKEAVTTFINPKMAEILGYTIEEMAGCSLFSFMDDEGKRICERLIERRKQGIREQHVFQFLKKDGTRIYASIETSPIKGMDGEYLGAIAGVTDITERKLAEEALRESQKRFQALTETTSDFVWEIDTNGVYTYCSPQIHDLWGYKPEDIIGRSPFDLVMPEEREQAIRMFRTISESSSPFKGLESRSRDNTGRIVVLETSGVPFFDSEGRVHGYRGISRDITERKRAEEALTAANRNLNLLSSITRHDITNQLTVLRGFLKILKKKQPDPSLNEYFQKIAGAAERISAMLKFTKEYDKIGVNAPIWQDTRTLVDIAAKQAPLGKVLVKNELPAGAEVYADPLVVKVFYNLMDNAVRYGGKITTIRFFAEEREGGHIIICEDDGDGVLAQEKEKIFERGFGKNTGLGLTLSKEILSITGITIRETGEPGRGARFEMVVPKGAYRLTEVK